MTRPTLQDTPYHLQKFPLSTMQKELQFFGSTLKTLNLKLSSLKL